MFVFPVVVTVMLLNFNWLHVRRWNTKKRLAKMWVSWALCLPFRRRKHFNLHHEFESEFIISAFWGAFNFCIIAAISPTRFQINDQSAWLRASRCCFDAELNFICWLFSVCVIVDEHFWWPNLSLCKISLNCAIAINLWHRTLLFPKPWQ